MAVVREDVRGSTGNLQSCVEQLAGGRGAEAAILAMREIFNKDNSEAVLLVDTKKCIHHNN